MTTCAHDAARHRENIISAVKEAITAPPDGTATLLSILRNGGWEHWLRHCLLTRLEKKEGDWGFTEANDDNSKRADLIFRCKDCEQVQFAVELKTNFLIQGESEINPRLSDSIFQLDGFVTNNIPSYTVYALTHLRGPETSSLVKAQTASTPWYKHFEATNAWPDQQPIWLPGQQGSYITADPALHVNCTAEVRVWVATVEMRGDTRILTFLNEGNFRYAQEWCKRDVRPAERPKRRKKRDMEWAPFCKLPN